VWPRYPPCRGCDSSAAAVLLLVVNGSREQGGALQGEIPRHAIASTGATGEAPCSWQAPRVEETEQRGAVVGEPRDG
jgi:hypothetical protein